MDLPCSFASCFDLLTPLMTVTLGTGVWSDLEFLSVKVVLLVLV